MQLKEQRRELVVALIGIGYSDCGDCFASADNCGFGSRRWRSRFANRISPAAATSRFGFWHGERTNRWEHGFCFGRRTVAPPTPLRLAERTQPRKPAVGRIEALGIIASKFWNLALGFCFDAGLSDGCKFSFGDFDT